MANPASPTPTADDEMPAVGSDKESGKEEKPKPTPTVPAPTESPKPGGGRMPGGGPTVRPRAGAGASEGEMAGGGWLRKPTIVGARVNTGRGNGKDATCSPSCVDARAADGGVADGREARGEADIGEREEAIVAESEAYTGEETGGEETVFAAVATAATAVDDSGDERAAARLDFPPFPPLDAPSTCCCCCCRDFSEINGGKASIPSSNGPSPE